MADAPPAGQPRRWDITGMSTVRCDVASVTASSSTVALRFGLRETRADGAAGVRLAQVIELTPYSAKRLQELLAVLVREHDRRNGGAGGPDGRAAS